MNNTKEEEILSCPGCQGDNLHQYKVVVQEKTNLDYLCTVHKGTSTYSPRSPRVDYPSERHTIDIHFWCEYCHGDESVGTHVLRIRQHKGTTYTSWISLRDALR